MKRIILILTILLYTVSGIIAQNTMVVQPKIMVVPYVSEGVDIRQTIENDPDIRLVLSKIREAFDNRGFSTVDFEAKLKSQSANNALSQNAQQDLKSLVIQGSGADIYVEAEYQYTESDAGNSVKVLMKACDVSTGNSLANKDAFSGVFRSNDVGRLAGAAVEKVADDFLSIIQSKFNDIVANGRSIIIDFKVDENSSITLNKEFNGEELADILSDWIADHSYKNRSSRILQAIGEVERIADHANYLSDSAEEIETKHLEFSDSARNELSRVIPAVHDIYTMALECYLSDNAANADNIGPLRIVISEMCDKFKANHVERLASGTCTTEQGFVFNDILYSCVRIAEHSLNIAAIAYRFKSNRKTDSDTYMHDFKQRKDKDEKKYQEYVRKYNA